MKGHSLLVLGTFSKEAGSRGAEKEKRGGGEEGRNENTGPRVGTATSPSAVLERAFLSSTHSPIQPTPHSQTGKLAPSPPPLLSQMKHYTVGIESDPEWYNSDQILAQPVINRSPGASYFCLLIPSDPFYKIWTSQNS